MPTQIQIKRGSTTPSGLTVGEQALNTSTNQVYIGGTGGTTWVGGEVTGGVDMGAGSAASAIRIPTQSGVYNYVRNNFVTSFNGLTGAVGGVTTSAANTFTAVQTFNSGVTFASTVDASGAARLSGGLTASRIDVTGNFKVVGDSQIGDQSTDTLTVFAGSTFNNRVDFGGTNVFRYGLTSAGAIRFSGNNAKTIITSEASLTIAGATSGPIAGSYNSMVFGVQTSDPLTMYSATGVVDIATNNPLTPMQPALRFNTDDQDFIGPGSIKIEPLTYATAARTQYLQDASGTLALTSQLMGAVNGSTAATTAVTSFNGLTGAVGGVCAAQANTFTALQSFNSGISASGGTFSTQLNTQNFRALTVGGDEGGQIDFGLPVTNTTLVGGVAIDINQDRVRIFETGGTNRGVYIDLAGVSAGVGTNLVGGGGGGGAVSSVSGSGNGISVSPTTGAVVVQNTGVHSFNGLTGAVGGVCAASANTFTAVQTFNSGVTLASTLDVTGVARFAAGVTVSGTLNGTTATFSRLLTGTTATFSTTVNTNNIIAISNITPLTISGSNGGVRIQEWDFINANPIVLDTPNSIYIGDYTGLDSGVVISIDPASSTVDFAGMVLNNALQYGLFNGEYIRNTTNGQIDLMPAPAGSTAFGLYADMTSWSFGVVLGTIRSSDGAKNTGGNFRFDVPLSINAETRFQLGSDGHYGFYRTDTGNNTGQIFAFCDGANNSGAMALVGYGDVGAANRSPTTLHTNPNLYIYANGTASANDFLRFEHDRTNANIVSGGTSGILIQPGSGTLGISGSVTANNIMYGRVITNITGATTALDNPRTDYVYNATSGTFTLTMPTAASNTNRYTVKNSGTGVVTIGCTASQTIDGDSTYPLSTQYQAVDLISNGTNWIVV